MKNSMRFLRSGGMKFHLEAMSTKDRREKLLISEGWTANLNGEVRR
jgi:hypothetical protein